MKDQKTKGQQTKNKEKKGIIPTPCPLPLNPDMNQPLQIIFFSGCSLQVVVFIECCNHLISQSFTALNILKLFEIFQTDIGQPL